jgi:hypothetical protein
LKQSALHLYANNARAFAPVRAPVSALLADQTLLSWSLIAIADHFVTMFHFFESFLNVQLTNEIRQVSECLRIPAYLPDGGELWQSLLRLLTRFARYPVVVGSLFTL